MSSVWVEKSAYVLRVARGEVGREAQVVPWGALPSYV